MIDLDFLHNAVDEGDFTDAVCTGLLDVLAEVKYLRAELAAERQDYDGARDTLLERVQALEGALPEAELLDEAADICGPDFHLQCRALRESACRIREAYGI